ncbi:MAG: DNA (cytosine-5-)-methyltransferase [Clostridium sp.]|uniref:DNA (cytosine-5-)-methyltransferase n=1 Tax=Clostridium sp. TaxID=1506 RepID=UPI003F2C8B9F
MKKTNSIIREMIPVQVRVRKFNVEEKELQQCLKKHKLESKLTIKEISKRLDVAKTEVEHWFRTDKCFSIPNDKKWLELKQLLSITTNEFDESIMTFEVRDGVFDKANRVYDENGIAPTITCVGADSERYKVYDNELIFSGGIYGSYSGLYKIKNKGEDIMWRNELKKKEYNMESVRLFDAFAGKGALHKSLKKLGVPTDVVGLSEVEPDAVIAYAGVHIDGFKEMEFDFPSDEEMRTLLLDRNIGWDFKKQKSCIPRMKKDKLKLLYKATMLTNNLGDISKIDYNNMFDFDLFNLSFPCTDVSNAGKQEGLFNEDGTHTRSGLIKFGLDIVRAKNPKLIMIENVKGLIQKKFIGDFYTILEDLEKMGYKCHYATKQKGKELVPLCLNAKNYGIPQNRERIFVICVRNDIKLDFKFNLGGDAGVRLKHLLQKEVEEKYYLSEEIQKRYKSNGENKDTNNTIYTGQTSINPNSQAGKTYSPNGVSQTLCAGTHGYAMGNIEEPKQIQFDLPCCKENKVDRLGGCFDKNGKTHQAGSVYNKEGVAPTITTCEGGYRQPIVTEENNIKVVGELECEGWHRIETAVHSTDGICPTMETRNRSKWLDDDSYRIRKLTPLECWRLMGFDDEDFYKVKDLGLSDSALYKLAGNSIVVNCLYYIFDSVFEKFEK